MQKEPIDKVKHLINVTIKLNSDIEFVTIIDCKNKIKVLVNILLLN